MTNPDERARHDEHARTTGGVRGAINDLLGRGDRPDHDRTADDRRTESERVEQERTGAAHDAGAQAPTGARFDGRPVDDRAAADPRQAGRPPAGAPTGARFEGQPVDQQQQGGGGAGVVGAAAPEQHGGQRPDERLGDPAAGGTPGGARHADVGAGGPGYAAPAQGRSDQHLTDSAAGSAGARTVDIGGHGDTSPSATTGPVATAGTAGDRTAGHEGSHEGHHEGHGSHGSHAGAVAQTSQGEDSEGREQLVSSDRAESYGSRWDAVKGQFVDEPRKAVADADALVGELLDELQTLFTEQRKGIERSMATDETSTEDMRLALRRYRSFFDRLLSI